MARGIEIKSTIKDLIRPIIKKIDEIVERINNSETLKIALVSHYNLDPDSVVSLDGAKDMFHQQGLDLEKIEIFADGNSFSRKTNILIKQANMKIKPLSEIDPKKHLIVLIDVKSAHQANLFLKDVKPVLILDHHNKKSPYASTATIITLLMYVLKQEINEERATALAIGIEIDTDNCTSRNFGKFDSFAYYKILCPIIDPQFRKKIIRCGHSEEFRTTKAKACTNKEKGGYYYEEKSIAVTCLGFINSEQRTFVPIVADELSKGDDINTVISTAFMENNGKESIVMSIRTSDESKNAGKFIQKILGKKHAGGDNNKAGGEKILDPITTRIIKKAKEDKDEKTLDDVIRLQLQFFLKKALEEQEQ